MVKKLLQIFVDELYRLNYKSTSITHRLPFYWYRPFKLMSRLLVLPIIFLFMV